VENSATDCQAAGYLVRELLQAEELKRELKA
jgi:hypothetical protein